MISGTFKLSAKLVFLSALLHLPALMLTFPTLVVPMIAAMVIWTLLGIGLLRGKRWCAWLAFFAMLFGATIALSNALSLLGLASMVFWVICIVDVVAAAVLFCLLWSPKSKLGAIRP